MCEEEKFSIHTNGYTEDLAEIDGANLSAYYDTVLSSDAMDLYVLGDIDPKQMEKEDMDIFSRKTPNEYTNVEKKHPQTRDEDVQFVTEKQSIQQAKLHLGYRTNTTYQDEDYPALQVFNGLYGGFPNSKLFLNVREKHS